MIALPHGWRRLAEGATERLCSERSGGMTHAGKPTLCLPPARLRPALAQTDMAIEEYRLAVALQPGYVTAWCVAAGGWGPGGR